MEAENCDYENDFFAPVFVDVKSHAQYTQNTQNQFWEEISPLIDNEDITDLPQVAPECIPPVLRDYALECAKHYQTAFEMPLFCALSCLATAIQGKFQVELKKGYVEPLNLYTIITAEPSELKSPTLKRFKLPLEQWEEEQHAKEKEIISSITSENKTLEKLIESKRAKVAKAKNKEELRELSQEIMELEKDLEDVPHYSRLFADDVTPESLGVIMENQGGRLSIAEAEGGFFAILAGRYSKGVPNLDLILKAYNAENVRIDRKGHKPIFIKNPCLTLLFLIQPYLLKNRENSEAFKGRGLDARFLYVMPASKVGYRTFESSAIDEIYADKYNAMIRHFLEMPTDKKQAEPYTLVMSNDAFTLYAEFMNTLETAMREGNELENMRDWAGKKGTLARLTGLLHCASHRHPQSQPISLDTVQKSCAVMTCLIAHAKRAYGFMFDNEELQIAKKILAWLNNLRPKDFSARDCFQSIKGKIKKQDEANRGLSLLEEHGYIRKLPLPVIQGSKGVGRPPSVRYEVHPHFYEGYR